MRVLPVATGSVQEVKQSFVMASTFQSACKANTSATPVGLGTAGIILVTPEPSPGFPQLRVPVASVGPACTVTSIEAFPTVIVAFTGPACGVISWITGAASAGLAVSMHATKRETARRILTALSWSDLRTPEGLNSSVTNALSDLFL